MKEPNWAKVLEVLYEEGGRIEYPAKGAEPDEEHPFLVRTGLSTFDVRVAIDDLRRTNLIRELTGTTYPDSNSQNQDRVGVCLTEKGFDVGHKREERKKQDYLMKEQKDATDTLADFTVILGATALIQALAAVVSAPRYSLVLAILYLILLGVLLYNREKLFHSSRF